MDVILAQLLHILVNSSSSHLKSDKKPTIDGG